MPRGRVVVLALFSIPRPAVASRRRQRRARRRDETLDPHFREARGSGRLGDCEEGDESRLGAVLPARGSPPPRSRWSGPGSDGEFASGLEARAITSSRGRRRRRLVVGGFDLGWEVRFVRLSPEERPGHPARLHRLDVPVRAVVLPLPAASAGRRRGSTGPRDDGFGEHFPGGAGSTG